MNEKLPSKKSRSMKNKKFDDDIPESKKKWGSSIERFCNVPSALLRGQRRLCLSPVQLALVMQLCDHWWTANKLPFPSKKVLGSRLNLSERQIGRLLKDLDDMGLVKRLGRKNPNGGWTSNKYDLSGLVRRLQALTREFKKVDEEVAKTKAAIGNPGLRKRIASD